MSYRTIAAIAGTLLAATLVAQQQEFELRNDRLVDGGYASIQAGFAVGESGGAVFNTSAGNFPLQVTKVRIFWQSLSGGQPDTLEDTIDFYQGGAETPPVPVLVKSLDGPVLHDGNLNEFDMTPYNIQFDHGPFAIALKFLTAPDPANGPSLVTDYGFGCEPKKNLIYAIPPGAWTNGCSLGITGDFVIRVVCVYAGASTTLTGHASLGLWSGKTAGLPYTIWVKDGSTVLDTIKDGTLDASGNYSAVSHQTGTHDVFMKVAHWLTEKQAAVSMGGAVNLDWQLNRNGDATGDDFVGISDLSSVLADYNSQTTAWSDLDGSGSVNLLDLSIVLNFFNQRGAQ